jgi:hypothetical protein
VEDVAVDVVALEVRMLPATPNAKCEIFDRKRPEAADAAASAGDEVVSWPDGVSSSTHALAKVLEVHQADEVHFDARPGDIALTPS